MVSVDPEDGSGRLRRSGEWANLRAMKTETMADRLGTTAHLSPLLMKARRLGLVTPEDLERLAVRRGLRYYEGSSASTVLREVAMDEGAGAPVSVKDFGNDELAVALLSPAWPYSQHRVRIAGAMLAATGNGAGKLAHLARMERVGGVVFHIARLGQSVEPENPLWSELVSLLNGEIAIDPDRLPHITRFVAMSGFGREGRKLTMQWIRPTKEIGQ